MRRTASEILRNLEMRVARLEKQSANKGLFEILWKDRGEAKKYYPSFSYEEDGRVKILSANAKDMEDFLKTNNFVIKKFERTSSDEMLYIMSDNHESKRDEWYVFVVREDQISKRSGGRIGWRIYHKKYR